MKMERIDDTHVCICPQERIDITNSNALKEEFIRLYDEGLTHLTVDFTHIDGIDSSGLGKLLLFQKRLKERNGSLRITNITSDYVKKMFTMIHLNRVIDID